jgi:hypothetical protein
MFKVYNILIFSVQQIDNVPPVNTLGPVMNLLNSGLH